MCIIVKQYFIIYTKFYNVIYKYFTTLMLIFFLKKIRKLFKSIGKLEFFVIEKLIFLENSINNFYLDDKYFKNFNFNYLKKKFFPKKLVIVICFFYNKKKIEHLKKNLDQISSYKFKKNLTIITNALENFQKKEINKILKSKINNYEILEIKDLPDDNLLPWYSLNIMKQKFKQTSNSHFMYLEDDILISDKNIFYWIYFRNVLKKFGLIPGFLRYEKNKNIVYSVDNPKKIRVSKNPHIYSSNKKFGFINSKYPYHAMYFMDRELMKNYLTSNAVSFDFGFYNRSIKSLYPIKEQLNISYAYIDVPKGFHNRLVIPFNNKKEILDYCLIKHNELKYSKLNKLTKLGYGTIEAKNLLI